MCGRGLGMFPLHTPRTWSVEPLLCQAPLPPPTGTRAVGGGTHQSGSCGRPRRFPRRLLLPWSDRVPGGRLLQGLTPTKPGSQRWESLQAQPWESSSRRLPPRAPETSPVEATLQRQATVRDGASFRPMRASSLGLDCRTPKALPPSHLWACH